MRGERDTYILDNVVRFVGRRVVAVAAISSPRPTIRPTKRRFAPCPSRSSISPRPPSAGGDVSESRAPSVRVR